MAQNLFRFTLSHVSGSQVISEPEGWNRIKMTLERDKEFHSIVELIETPFLFYGSNGVHDGGKDYLKNINSVYGVDAQVTITIEISTDGGFSYDDLFVGLIDMQSLRDIDSRKIEVVIIPDDLWSRFKNRIDTTVNIQSTTDIDDNPVTPADPITINLTPQRVVQKYIGELKNNFYYGGIDSGNYAIVEYTDEILSEIKEMYTYVMGPSNTPQITEVPFEKFYLEYDGLYEVDCKISAGITNNSGPPQEVFITISDTVYYTTDPIFEVYIQINQQEPIAFSKAHIPIAGYVVNPNPSVSNPGIDVEIITDVNSKYTEYTFHETLNLKKSDIIRIYFKNIGVINPIEFDLTVFGKNGDGYEQQEPYKFAFGGEYDPVSTLFPTYDFTVNGWKISRDGNIWGIPVYKGWYIRLIDISGPSQDPADWYIGPLAPFENLFQIAETYLRVTGSTITDPTDGEGFFTHDVAGAALDRITGIPGRFYSEYIGSQNTNYRTYAENGCGWPFVNIKGLQLREYTLADKPFFISFKDWWSGLNPIHNLGLGYDIIGGDQVIRVEEKEFFYDPSPIIYLSWVNNIIESYDKDYIFKKIRIGFNKWQSEDISGIDDPQTKHTYATIFKIVGQELIIESNFIAASLAIETTRRTTKEKSKDYKFDNETFIIAINPNEVTSPTDSWNPELDENYNSVTNLLNSETRYNLVLTPARSLFRWWNFILGGLQNNLTSSIKFMSGEGNYDMISDYSAVAPGYCFAKMGDPLSEKQDIDLSIYGTFLGHLFQPIIWEFKHPLSFENYKLIRDNRTRAIAVSGADGDYQICFIKKLEYDLINSLGTFTVWKK